MQMLKKITSRVLVCALALSALQTQAATEFKRYHNARFGYSVMYPADFKAFEEAENGDGRIFQSPQKDAELRVYGMFCLDTLTSFLASYQAEADAGKIKLIYSNRESDSVVVSGLKDGKIFYHKVIMREPDSADFHSCSNMEMEYLPQAAGRYSPIAKHVGASLTPALEY